jgi:hypothetical protein
LLDANLPKVWGILHVGNRGYVFGTPTASERAFLAVLLAREAARLYYAKQAAEPFPLSRSEADRVRAIIAWSHGSLTAQLQLVDQALMAPGPLGGWPRALR